MIMEEQINDYPLTIPCPNCGRKMRLNYFMWKEPKYVCESFRSDDDCEMVMMLRDYQLKFDRCASA